MHSFRLLDAFRLCSAPFYRFVKHVGQYGHGVKHRVSYAVKDAWDGY